MRARNLVAAGALSVLAVVAAADPALAEGSGTPVAALDRMVFDVSAGATSGWQAVRGDSPRDDNTRALLASVPTGSDTAPARVVVATHRSLDLSLPLGAAKNISFDFRSTQAQGASPYFVVRFVDDDDDFTTPQPAAALPAPVCRKQIGTSAWSRADFTGAKRDCMIFFADGEAFDSYSADGTRTALQVLAAARPDLVVESVVLAFTEPGQYSVDRVALGTDLLYNAYPGRAVRCQGSELRC